MKLLKKEWLQLVILAVPFCAAARLWAEFPNRLPSHWNLWGQVDGYAGKTFGTLFLPSLNVALVLLLAILPRLDPKCRTYDVETRASVTGVFRVFRLASSMFLSALTLAIYAVALHFPLDVTRFVTGGLGLLIAVLGNSMGKLRPNYFAGFRTPWSFKSRTVWMKTHRLGGRLMVGCGLGLFAESLLLPVWLCVLAGVLPLVVLTGVVPLVYSYVSYRAEQRSSGPAH